jgi:DNA-binding CsgD family transcriptional regulator
VCSGSSAARIESSGKIHFRPELAITRLRLAELLLEEADDGGRLEALKHLDIAIPELRDMHMRPWLERALAVRDNYRPSQVHAPARHTAPDALTSREQEVARLLAAGRSNREIADGLTISEGTVEVHVKHILSKLGFRSRAQVAAWAADERV